MQEKKTNRQIQADQTRERILREAKRLIEEKPISEIRIQDITKACGVAIGTFYHYFDSKERLFAVIALESDTPQLWDIRHASHLPLMERLRSFLSLRAKTVEHEGTALTQNLLQFRMTSRYREIRDEMFGHEHFEYALCATILQDGIANRELKEDLPVDFYAQMIVYTFHGIVANQCLYDEPLTISGWIEEFLDYLQNIALKPYLIK